MPIGRLLLPAAHLCECLAQKEATDAEQSGPSHRSSGQDPRPRLGDSRGPRGCYFANSLTEMEPIPEHSVSWKAELSYALNRVREDD